MKPLLQEQLAETSAFIRQSYFKEDFPLEKSANSETLPLIQGAVVLGSGLSGIVKNILPLLENVKTWPYASLPHFPTSAVQGHGNCLTIGRLRSETGKLLSIAFLQGRFHYYECNQMDSVVYPIRMLQQLGAEFTILTNAAGGIREDLTPSSLMLIEDHLNLMGDHPLKGNNPEFLGSRFFDMSQAYCPRLRQIAMDVALRNNLILKSGVYAALSGPSYETPAEIRMLRILGADAVGMSTVPEVIAARHMGVRVLGISCITNTAAGLSTETLNHEEVMQTALRVEAQLSQLIQGVIQVL